MSIYREPARMATIQLRKAAEQRSVEPVVQPNKGLLAPKKMVKKEMGSNRKTESARVLDIMLAVREAMNGEA